MRVLTSEQMQKVDAETTDRICPGIELMERAGRGVAEFVLSEFGPDPCKAAVFVGSGNNGGDGLVVARHLLEAGWACSVHRLKGPARFAPDAAKNYRRYLAVASDRPRGREYDAGDPDWPERLVEDLADTDLIIDAVFGTGVSGAPGGPALDAIEAINEAGAPIVSIDIPSGVNGTTADVPGEAVVADVTLTIGAPKIGLLFHPGKLHCGSVRVIDIGFPEEIIQKHGDGVFLIDNVEAAYRLPLRAPDAHKFNAGTLLLIAGSDQYRGAAMLAGEAALRSGAGMVYLGVPASIRAQIDAGLREVITFSLPETDAGTAAARSGAALEPYLDRADAVAIGPGMGRNPETDAFIRNMLASCALPVVIDADAIAAFAGFADALGALPGKAVVTPHSGELKRLLGRPVPEDVSDRIAFTRRTADSLDVTLIHKGAPTIVGSPGEGAWINASGGPELACGGTGDVLTGVAGGLLAQGAGPTGAACVACHLHGRAGELARVDLGIRGVVAGDLLVYLGRAIRALEDMAGD